MSKFRGPSGKSSILLLYLFSLGLGVRRIKWFQSVKYSTPRVEYLTWASSAHVRLNISEINMAALIMKLTFCNN